MLLEIGRIVKPHGIRGEVLVDLVTTRTERLEVGSVVVTDRGNLIVDRSSPHQGRWIVAFAGVGDRNRAEELRGTVLRAEPLPGGEGELWVHELIGAAVVDRAGRPLGSVTAVEANPASDLLVLDSGPLIPLTFVVEQQPDGTIVVDPPPGLIDAE